NGTGERRVRVAVDEQDVRLLRLESGVNALHHARRHMRVTSAMHGEVVVRVAQPKLPEEHVRHAIVEVLPRVHENLFNAARGGERTGDGRCLDELRPCADDGEHLHARAARSGRGCACSVLVASRIWSTYRALARSIEWNSMAHSRPRAPSC